MECGRRFLTDCLDGDTYSKTHREGQSLDRCRTQVGMVADMEPRFDEMEMTVEKHKRE